VPNPMLDMIGYFIIENAQGGATTFVMGTTAWNTSGVNVSKITACYPDDHASHESIGAGSGRYPRVTGPDTVHTIDDTTHTVTNIGAGVSLDPSAPNVTRRVYRGK